MALLNPDYYPWMLSQYSLNTPLPESDNVILLVLTILELG